MAGLVLRGLTADDEAAALAAHEELARDDFEFLLSHSPDMPWPEYVARLERGRHGIDVPTGWVPATFLVADVDGQLVGRVSLRHELNEVLAAEGGHIGYAVRPAFRGRGYATEILRQALQRAAELGIEQALLTCHDSNRASAAVIERCGGVLEQVIPRGPAGKLWRRYWVPTRPIG